MVENAFFCKNELFVNTHFSMRAPIFTCARKIPCFFIRSCERISASPIRHTALNLLPIAFPLHRSGLP